MVLIDGAGPAHTQDATIRGAPRTDAVGASPHIAALVAEGILLDRHHTYLWCSPTRRAFLTGRYPVHITGIQAPTCSNLTPLQFTILSEKLKAAEYESHFIGKGSCVRVLRVYVACACTFVRQRARGDLLFVRVRARVLYLMIFQ